MVDVHPAIISGYGLVEARFDRVLATFGHHKRADQSTVSVFKSPVTVAEAISFLDVRTWGATRLVLVDLGNWTGVLTNHKGGSSFSDHQHWAAQSVGTRTVRVVDSEARWRRDGRRRIRLAWETRAFELHGDDDEPIRVIENAHDGDRWTFHTFGDPLPFETDAPYEAADERERFSQRQLHGVLDGLGPGPLTAARLLGVSRGALLRERRNDAEWQARTDADAITMAEDDAR